MSRRHDCPVDPQKAKNKKNLYGIVISFFISILLILHFSALYMNWWPTLSGQWGLTHKISGAPIGGDFPLFYAASSLILEGSPLKVYDPSILKETIQLITGGQKDAWWIYPPIIFLIIFPLALLPYLSSLFLWLGLTLSGYLWIIRRLAPHPLTPWLVLAFPGAFINFIFGQNGFLTSIMLGGGLLLLDHRPRLAGLVLGLLCYKPHFAVLTWVALLVARRWPALVTAAISVITLTVMSLLAFGPEVWLAFFASTDSAINLLKDENLWRIWSPTTIFVTTRLWGGSVALAWALQSVIMLLAGAVVAYVWRNSRDTSQYTPYIRNAVLVLATLLFTPYAHSYDLAILALPLAWLGWESYSHGRLQFYEACLLTVGYITPFLVYPFGELIHHFPLAPIVFLTLILNAIFRRRVNDPLVSKASWLPGG